MGEYTVKGTWCKQLAESVLFSKV